MFRHQEIELQFPNTVATFEIYKFHMLYNKCYIITNEKSIKISKIIHKFIMDNKSDRNLSEKVTIPYTIILVLYVESS